MIESIIDVLNNSKIFVGCIMLLMNLGGRYIANELPSNIDQILNRKWVRILIICSIIFVATRDIKISILLTLLFVLLFKFLLDNSSKFCILESSNNNNSGGNHNNSGNNNNINKEEAIKAYKLLREYQKQNSRPI